MGCAYLYRVHVVLQYATDVKNLIIHNLITEILGGKYECDLFALKIVWNTASLT